MNLKSVILVGLAAAGCWATAGAKGNITGTVLNKDSGEPMDYVNVQIFDKNTKILTVS